MPMAGGLFLCNAPIAHSGKPIARRGTPFAGHKNLRAIPGTPFAKPGDPLASHGNADVRLGKGVAVRHSGLRQPHSWSRRGGAAKGLDG